MKQNKDKRSRIKPATKAGRYVRSLVLHRIPLRPAWWRVVYYHESVAGFIPFLAGMIIWLLGWVGPGLMIASSTVALRRAIYWFDVLRVEPHISRRTLGVIRLERFIQLTGLSLKSHWIFWGVLIAFVLKPFKGELNALDFWLLLLLLLLALTEFGPPFVLFLGSSDKSFPLFIRVMIGCMPHRAVTLLRQKKWALDKWRARTKEPDHWREVVQRFARLACVIVVDGRFPTPAINEECDWLLKKGMIYKMVIVGDEHGRCPVLDALISQAKQDESKHVLIVSPEAVQSVVHAFTMSRHHVPSERLWASSILRDLDLTPSSNT